MAGGNGTERPRARHWLAALALLLLISFFIPVIALFL